MCIPFSGAIGTSRTRKTRTRPSIATFRISLNQLSTFPKPNLPIAALFEILTSRSYEAKRVGPTENVIGDSQMEMGTSLMVIPAKKCPATRPGYGSTFIVFSRQKTISSRNESGGLSQFRGRSAIRGKSLHLEFCAFRESCGHRLLKFAG